MGATYVDVTIRNPADPGRSWTGSFLVDTGAFDSLVPRVQLDAIGLTPRGSREYVLADGKSVAMDITMERNLSLRVKSWAEPLSMGMWAPNLYSA